MSKPTVAILLTPDMRAKLIPKSAEDRLAQMANVRAPSDGELTSENLPRLLDGAVAAITGWGTPPLDETLLAQANSLRLVAHAAGSIRHLVPFAAINEGRLQVTHAAIHIGEAVSEFVMAQVLSFLRHPSELADGMRNNELLVRPADTLAREASRGADSWPVGRGVHRANDDALVSCLRYSGSSLRSLPHRNPGSRHGRGVMCPGRASAPE